MTEAAPKPDGVPDIEEIVEIITDIDWRWMIVALAVGAAAGFLFFVVFTQEESSNARDHATDQ